jgi:hypothetical protein
MKLTGFVPSFLGFTSFIVPIFSGGIRLKRNAIAFLKHLETRLPYNTIGIKPTTKRN